MGFLSLRGVAQPPETPPNLMYVRNIKAVQDIIIQSKNLTFLKIKSLNTKATNKLVSIALKACPKLRHLEIVEPTDGEYCM